MEVIIDQLDTVKSNSDLEKVNNPEKVTNLVIKNYNKETQWNKLENFANIEVLHLENCWLDNFNFFTAISKLQKLTTFKYNENCIFKKSDKKINTKYSKLNKIVFIFNKKDDPDLSLLSLSDKESLSNNFINSFPNFPSAYQNINEIELVNYEDFLEKVKEEDYDYLYNGIYNGKDIFFKCDIYNLSRIKNLNNIRFCEKDNEIFEKKIIVEKLFSFPSHKSIKINNTLIKEFKDKFLKGKNLYLDYTYYPFDDNLLTNIKRHSSIRDCLEVHWPSQKYNGYKNNFKELLKQEIENVIVGPTFDFIYEQYFDYEGSSVDDFEKDILKIKSLKKITFEISDDIITRDHDTYDWNITDSDGYYMDVFIRLIHNILKKNIIVEIDFKEIKSSNDLNDNFNEYIQLFYLFINIQSDKKLKNKFTIKNLDPKKCEDFFNQVVLNEFKSIIIIDDQSDSELLKKFKNIELIHDWQPDIGLEVLNLNSGLVSIDMSKIKLKKDKSAKDFLWNNETWPKQFWDEKHFSNPGKTKVFVKKSFLDKSTKTIFNNLENISFHLIGKISFPPEKFYQNKIFNFPKTINYTNVKTLTIDENFPINLADIEVFQNLVELNINNHLNVLKPNFRKLPSLNKLKYLNFGTNKPENENETEQISNIENSKNLETIIIRTTAWCKDTEMRYNIPLDLKNFHTLSKLKKLELNGIHIPLLKNIGKVVNIESFELINPRIVTEEEPDDFFPIDKPMTEKDLNFIKYMTNLKNLKLFLPRFSSKSHNFDYKKIVTLINPKLKELEIHYGFAKEKNKDVHEMYKNLTSSFEKLEKLKININCIDPPALKYNDKIEGAYEKAELKRNEQAKSPLLIDFLKLKKMKDIEVLEIYIDGYFGIRAHNITEIENLKKLKKINIKFDYNDLKIDIKELRLLFNKIATKRQKFLIQINENKTYKNKDVVKYRWHLNEEDKEKYDLIEEEEERDMEINGHNLETTIFNTFEK